MIAESRSAGFSHRSALRYAYSEHQRLVDIELFSDIRRIENALKQRSCTEALAWCSENKSALRKVKVGIVSSLAHTPLEFHMAD